MELLIPLLAALLIGTGVFLLLSRALIRLIVGLSLISYGVNLSILVAGAGVGQASPPLLNVAGPHVDPLPQALILTAIVIGFGTTALLLVLATRAYQMTGTDHVQELVERPDPLEPPVVYADPEQPSVSPERGSHSDRAMVEAGYREREATVGEEEANGGQR
ncbi:MAG TPA: sodium:proton antiporter [Trueperaceae bacterium]